MSSDEAPPATLPPASGRRTKGAGAIVAKDAGAVDDVEGGNATNRAVIDALAGQLRKDNAARAAAVQLLATSGTAARHVLLLAVARACSQGELRGARA